MGIDLIIRHNYACISLKKPLDFSESEAGAAVLTQETDETPCINTPLPSTSLQESGTGVGTDSQPLRLQKDRLKSLDAFRGYELPVPLYIKKRDFLIFYPSTFYIHNVLAYAC